MPHASSRWGTDSTAPWRPARVWSVIAVRRSLSHSPSTEPDVLTAGTHVLRDGAETRDGCRRARAISWTAGRLLGLTKEAVSSRSWSFVQRRLVELTARRVYALIEAVSATLVACLTMRCSEQLRKPQSSHGMRRPCVVRPSPIGGIVDQYSTDARSIRRKHQTQSQQP